MTDEYDDPEKLVADVLKSARPAPRDPGADDPDDPDAPGADALAALRDLDADHAERGTRPAAAEWAARAGAVLAALRPALAADPVHQMGERLAQRLLGERDPNKAIDEWVSDPENRKAAPALLARAAVEWRRGTVATITDKRRLPLLTVSGRPDSAVLLRGDVALLSGDGGRGKSTLVNEIALAVAGGRPVRGVLDVRGNEIEQTLDGPEIKPAVPARVLWLAYEEGRDWIKDRLEVLAQNRPGGLTVMNNVEIVDPDGAALFGPPAGASRSARGAPLEGWSYFERDVAEVKPELIVIDTASEAYVGDVSDPAAVSDFVRALRRLARQADAGVLIVTHSNKPPGAHGKRDALDAGHVAGAQAWSQKARGVMVLDYLQGGGADEAGRRQLTITKANRGQAFIAIALEPCRPVKGSGTIYGMEGAPGATWQTVAELKAKAGKAKANGADEANGAGGRVDQAAMALGDSDL
ncbi:MAG: AAA family ATPase [Rhodospirillaceae bacterium]|nr:AAA family ATPase [Rhodospirillaceae bacterium]